VDDLVVSSMLGVSHGLAGDWREKGVYQGFSCSSSSLSGITRDFSRYFDGRQLHEVRFLGIAMFMFEIWKERHRKIANLAVSLVNYAKSKVGRSP